MDFCALFILISLSILSFVTAATSLSPALILTPYLEQNHTDEARKLSKVDPLLFLNITSHSGFLTVDKKYNSNTFFWYFPVEGKPVNETPWLIWLQGGPGASSLIGLFDEMGPFEYDVGTAGIKCSPANYIIRKQSTQMQYARTCLRQKTNSSQAFFNIIRPLQTCAACSFSSGIWENALYSTVSIPCPSLWGEKTAQSGWTPEWTRHTAIWSKLGMLDIALANLDAAQCVVIVDASAYHALFNANPAQVAVRIKLREWSWWRNYSMVFIDNPIGSGFSFTDNEAGYAHNMTEYSTHLNTAVQQLVSIFPELRTAPLYIAGESYAGKYGPALATKLTTNQTSSATVNLQGIILANPTIDPADQTNYTEMFYSWGLADTQGVLATKDLQDAYSRAVDEGNATKAFELRNKLLDKLSSISAQTQTYNIINDNYDHLEDFTSYLRKEEVKEALHVGDTKFEYNSNSVIQKLVPDFLNSATENIEALLELYRVLIYCGQLDVMAGCGRGGAARRHWRWSRREQFLLAPRTPWANGNDSLTGYVKSGGGLTEVLVRGAGHLTARDKPKAMSQLISYFIRGIDLPSLSNYRILPENTPPIPIPIPTSNTSKGTQTDNNKTSEGTSLLINSGVVVSILINVILVVIIVVGIILYVRMKRKYDSFYYSNVDNLSDDIFLS